MKISADKIKNCVIFWLSTIVLVFLDQMTKYGAVKYLKNGSPFVIWDNVFELHFLENRGAAFGILQGGKILFVAITFIMILFLFYIFMKLPKEKKFLPVKMICIFLEGGAIGNMIDRVTKGVVTDFFYFKLINFPIFNVADIYVTCCVFCLIFLFLFYYKEEDLEIMYTILIPWHNRKHTKKDSDGTENN